MVTASEMVPAGAAMFQAPGEGRVVVPVPEPVDHSTVPAAQSGICPPHPKGRVHKGFCGLCGRQVGDDEKIK